MTKDQADALQLHKDYRVDADLSALVLAVLDIAAKAAGHESYIDSYWEATADWSSADYLTSMNVLRARCGSNAGR